MFYQSQPVSAYLVKPSLNPLPRASWDGFRTNWVEVKRANPKLLRRSLVALAIWCTGVGAFQTISGVPLSGSRNQPSLLVSSQGTASLRSNNPATAIHAPVLPSGPSGQLLPPGSLAQTGTYANSYAWGQCTWYVAGRRQVPSNWGNAVSWYYHASSSGWSVGTTPAVAAIAWTPVGRYGHVAVVEQVSADGSQVTVSEMNYRGVGVKSIRTVAAKQFKYIY